MKYNNCKNITINLELLMSFSMCYIVYSITNQLVINRPLLLYSINFFGLTMHKYSSLKTIEQFITFDSIECTKQSSL